MISFYRRIVIELLHFNFLFIQNKKRFPIRYADILAGKLQSKVTAIQKIETTRKLLKEKIEKFKNEKVSIQPLVGQLTEQTKMLQSKVITSIRMQIVFMSFFFLY